MPPTPVYQYATIAQLSLSGVQPAALSGFTDPQKNAALLSASRLLDGYLRSKFTLPLVQAGDDLARATAIVAAYDLMVSRGYNPSAGGDPIILTRYKEIIGTPPLQLGWADLVANGKITPDVTDSSPGATEGRPAARARIVSSSQRGYSGRPGTSTGSRSDTGPFTTD
jgi:phage gp36-like protein